MSSDFQSYFIAPDTLAAKLNSPDLRLVDASWYLPAMGRDGKAEFDAARIPGARYFDINAIADTSSDLPHMLPSEQTFADAVGQMGISENDEIVIYDGPGVFSSARVWWTFRIMGAKRVFILAGGMDGWKAKGLPLETDAPKPPSPATFNTQLDVSCVRDAAFMKANVKRGETLVLDARPFARFTGEAEEPRAGLRKGHIPGSKSLPAMDTIKDGQLLPTEQIAETMAAVGVNPKTHVTTTCGSGVTAAILSLALSTIGHENHSLYDASWAEWGALPDVPVARWK